MAARKRRRSKHLAAAAAKRARAAAALEAEEPPPRMPLSLAAPTTFELYYQAQVRASLPFREAALAVHAALSTQECALGEAGSPPAALGEPTQLVPLDLGKAGSEAGAGETPENSRQGRVRRWTSTQVGGKTAELSCHGRASTRYL
jgi:hypothetical protein